VAHRSLRDGRGQFWQVIATLHFDYYVKTKYKDQFDEVDYLAATFDPVKQVSIWKT
jgi:hypothetical protein